MSGPVKLRLLQIIRRELEKAEQVYLESIAEHAGQIASASAWDSHHKDDGIGAFSGNPYSSRITYYSDRERTARANLSELKQVYELVVDKFVGSELESAQ